MCFKKPKLTVFIFETDNRRLHTINTKMFSQRQSDHDCERKLQCYVTIKLLIP